MQSQLPLNLLQQKINELQTALFFNRSTSIFRIPSSVIHVIAVDEAGQIWFCLPSLQQTASELDEHFFCDLQFFRKEKEFYVRISGIASMVKDPEDINDISFMSQEMKALIRAGRSILIKVKIRGADYFENKEKKKMEIRKTSLIQRLSTLSFFVQSLKKQLFPEHHHPVM